MPAQSVMFTPPAEPEKPDTTPRIVNGQQVVSDEPDRSPLTGVHGKFIPFHGRRVLKLADGSTVFGCADCDVTGERGAIMAHRIQKHGAKKPGNTGKKAAEAEPMDLGWLGMSIGELIDLAGHVGGVEAEIDRLREEVERERERRITAERTVTKYERAFAKLGFVMKEGDE